MMLALALASLALALLSALLVVGNLAILRPPAPARLPDDFVSILIPARNEEAGIARAVEAALASEGVPVEVLVGDDDSEDTTAAIVQALAGHEPRLRLVRIPPLPGGWTGKNHACARLAAQARGGWLLFIDADVRLSPGAAASLAGHARASGAALVSAVPRQSMESLGEFLTVPIINFVLLGYLPMALMRRRPDPSLGAACGQLILIEHQAYRASGGHGAISPSLHDGLALPRLMRRTGHRTDLVAGACLAQCRMYRGLHEAWAGFSKNAREGMAQPRALPLWTLLLFGGHVLPWLILAGSIGGGSGAAASVAACATALSVGTRAAVTITTREPTATIPLHPAAIVIALAIQWNALLSMGQCRVASWKGRSYPSAPPISRSRQAAVEDEDAQQYVP